MTARRVEVSVSWAEGQEAYAPQYEPLVSRVVRCALEAEGVSAGEVSVYLTDDAEIRTLNAHYRDRDEATDVLSFPLHDEAFAEEVPLLGEIIVSVERAAAQADMYAHTFERELAFLLVHGTLHVLGYDHQSERERREMRTREEAILAQLELFRA